MAMLFDAPLSLIIASSGDSLSDLPAAHLILTAITVKLAPEASHTPAELRQELILNALVVALLADDTNAVAAWTAQAVPEGDPLLYHLTPLLESSISLEAAWQMIYALRAQPQIAKAEPIFVTRYLPE